MVHSFSVLAVYQNLLTFAPALDMSATATVSLTNMYTSPIIKNRCYHRSFGFITFTYIIKTL